MHAYPCGPLPGCSNLKESLVLKFCAGRIIAKCIVANCISFVSIFRILLCQLIVESKILQQQYVRVKLAKT